MNPAPEHLKIEALDGQLGVRVLKLTGPLTIRTLFDLQTAVRAESAKPVIIDLTGVPYMDSAGLGSVVSAYTSCQRSGHGFGVCGLSERIRTLFEVTHVDGLLPVFPTLEAAQTAIK